MVTLAPICEAQHARLLYEWRRRADIARAMYSSGPSCMEDHLRWLRSLPQDSSRLYRIIEMRGRPVGAAYLTEIDSHHRRAMLGMYVADEGARTQGAGAAAEFLMLDHAFHSLGLHKIGCEVFASNTTPVKLHDRMGFVHEGVLRHHALLDGTWTDVIRLSLLAPEWESSRPALATLLKRLLDTPCIPQAPLSHP